VARKERKFNTKVAAAALLFPFIGRENELVSYYQFLRECVACEESLVSCQKLSFRL
jgi:hypothetical protein